MNDENTPIAGFSLFDNSAMTRVVDKITLTTNGQFNFPAAFYNVNNLAGMKSARIYYNPQDKKIAIRFSSDEDPKGFKFILSNGGKYGGYIAAKSFITLNKIDVKAYGGRYDYEKAEAPGGVYFIIDLKAKDTPEGDGM